MGFSRSTAGSSNPRLLRHLGCRHPIPLIPTHSRRRGDLSWSIGFHRSPIRQFPSWLTSGKGTVDSRLEVLPRGEKFPGRIAPSASSALSRPFQPHFSDTLAFAGLPAEAGFLQGIAPLPLISPLARGFSWRWIYFPFTGQRPKLCRGENPKWFPLPSRMFPFPRAFRTVYSL